MNWNEKVCHAAQLVEHDPDVIGDAEYADGYVDGAVTGAHWMRDQLRTDEAIERAAVELAERHDRVPFDQMPGFIQNAWRADARACVDALLGEEPCRR